MGALRAIEAVAGGLLRDAEELSHDSEDAVTSTFEGESLVVGGGFAFEQAPSASSAVT